MLKVAIDEIFIYARIQPNFVNIPYMMKIISNHPQQLKLWIRLYIYPKLVLQFITSRMKVLQV